MQHSVEVATIIQFCCYLATVKLQHCVNFNKSRYWLCSEWPLTPRYLHTPKLSHCISIILQVKPKLNLTDTRLKSIISYLFFLTVLNIEEEFLQTWNHLACLKAARASKHFCLSSTSGGSLVACAWLTDTESRVGEERWKNSQSDKITKGVWPSRFNTLHHSSN